MAILIEAKKLLYIQVPATGCSVVGNTLIKKFDGVSIGNKHDSIRDLINKNILQKEDLDNLVVVANVANPFDRLLTYYVRLTNNHWVNDSYRIRINKINASGADELVKSRGVGMVDKWRKRQYKRAVILKLAGFNFWVISLIFRKFLIRFKSNAEYEKSLHELLFPMSDGVSWFLRKENLESDFNCLQKQILKPEFLYSLPKRNVTKNKDNYQNYYWKTTRFLIEKTCEKYLKKYEYSFDA